jgi:hypothetical protein
MDELRIDRRQDDEHGFHAHVTDRAGRMWEVVVAPRGSDHWVGEAGTGPRAPKIFRGTTRQDVIDAALQHIRDQQPPQ